MEVSIKSKRKHSSYNTKSNNSIKCEYKEKSTHKSKFKPSEAALTVINPYPHNNLLTINNFLKSPNDSQYNVPSNRNNKSKRKKTKGKKDNSKKKNFVSLQFKIACDFDEKGTIKFLKDKDKCLEEMKLSDDIEYYKKKKTIEEDFEDEDKKLICDIGEYFVKISVGEEGEGKEEKGEVSSIKSIHKTSKNLGKLVSKKSIFSSESGSEDARSISNMLSEVK